MSRLSLTILLALSSSALLGCNSGQSQGARSLTDTSMVLETPAFVPPHDPAMGQISLAIPEVIVSAPGGEYIGLLGESVRSQLTSTLAASPNFLVVDRSLLNAIGDEHRLADAGAIRESDRPVPGQLAGARYLVEVDVNELQERVVEKGKGGGIRLGAVAQVLDIFVGGNTFDTASRVVQAADPTVGRVSGTMEGVVGMELRVVDVSTGVVVATTRAQAKLTREHSSTVLGVAGVSTSSQEYAGSVIAHATRAAVENATIQLHAAMNRLANAGPVTTGDVLTRAGM